MTRIGCADYLLLAAVFDIQQFLTGVTSRRYWLKKKTVFIIQRLLLTLPEEIGIQIHSLFKVGGSSRSCIKTFQMYDWGKD